MKKLPAARTMLLTCCFTTCAFAQDLANPTAPVLQTRHAPATRETGESSSSAAAPALQWVPLVVPRGAALEVRLDQEVRVNKAGQDVHGKVTEDVYAFDRVVIPAGTEINGKIEEIEDISGGRRTLAALDANFTPDHRLVLQFDDLVMADGSHRSLKTTVLPGTGEPLEFVTAPEGENKGAAATEIEKAKRQAKQTWNEAKRQVSEPGRMHRLARYVEAQLPFHHHYLDEGAMFSAELEEPLDFGTAPLTAANAATIGNRPVPGAVVRARLMTPLNSATTKEGEQVEALLSRPLFDGDHLILPAGSSLRGTVLQAHPAEKLHHNGQLRIVFHELAAPQGFEMRVNAVPVGVAAARSEHVELDAEGGAQATSPETRYLNTALAVGLAAASAGTDADARGGGDAGNVSNRAAGGVGGFKLVGLVVGLAIKSQPLGLAMGALGASRSIYANFLGHGRELVFPKNTVMDVSVGGNPVPAAGCEVVSSESAPSAIGKSAACALRQFRVF